jgi:hypothetical protein
MCVHGGLAECEQRIIVAPKSAAPPASQHSDMPKSAAPARRKVSSASPAGTVNGTRKGLPGTDR